MPTTALMTGDLEQLASRLAAARAHTDSIFARLEPAALYERPIPERHRLVFYLGHVEAFDWNLIARQAFGIDAFHPDFDRLFAFGIDPVDGGLPNEPASDWPRREEIEAYNRQVRERIDECVSGRRSPPTGTDLDTLFNMAIEHRLMHAETLAYLLHALPFEAKRPANDPPMPARAAEPRGGVARIPAGIATLGRSRAAHRFGWDNEFEQRAIEAPAFSIDVQKITNGRFLEFVQDGGYREPRLWSDSDREWIERQHIRHPGFWIERDGAWHSRGMFAERPLALEAPVYVSHAEAAAFARWAKRALPTEVQFHRAAYGTPQGEEREYPWGAEPPAERHGNFDLRRWEPTPVGAFPDGDSAFGVSELVGNGWEWTSSVFEPFPGFRAHPFYAGYSANFFDGSHYVLKGGSPRTAAVMLRRSFRNWFQPHYPHLYASFRLVS